MALEVIESEALDTHNSHDGFRRRPYKQINYVCNGECLFIQLS